MSEIDDAKKGVVAYTYGPFDAVVRVTDPLSTTDATDSSSRDVDDYGLSSNATSRLISAGAVFQRIPAGGMPGGFPGLELYVPTSAFDTFNELLGAGDIAVKPY